MSVKVHYNDRQTSQAVSSIIVNSIEAYFRSSLIRPNVFVRDCRLLFNEAINCCIWWDNAAAVLCASYPAVDLSSILLDDDARVNYKLKPSRRDVISRSAPVAAMRTCRRSALIITSGQNILTKDLIAVLSPLAAENGFIRPWPHLIHGSLEPHVSWLQQHLDQFSRFRRSHERDQLTHRPTTEQHV